MKPSYDFLMDVNSTNAELKSTLEDNHQSVSIPLWVDAILEFEGSSHPAEIYYNSSMFTSETIKKENDIGSSVIHLYTVRNKGPSKINEAEVVILWPFATLAGEDFLYLLEQPHTLGNVQCEPAEANYRNYDLEARKKSVWETTRVEISKGELGSSSTAKLGGTFDGSQNRRTFSGSDISSAHGTRIQQKGERKDESRASDVNIKLEKGTGTGISDINAAGNVNTNIDEKILQSGDASDVHIHRHTGSKGSVDEKNAVPIETQGSSTKIHKNTTTQYITNYVNNIPITTIITNTSTLTDTDGTKDYSETSNTEEKIGQGIGSYYDENKFSIGGHQTNYNQTGHVQTTQYGGSPRPHVVYSSSGSNHRQETDRQENAGGASSGSQYSISSNVDADQYGIASRYDQGGPQQNHSTGYVKTHSQRPGQSSSGHFDWSVQRSNRGHGQNAGNADYNRSHQGTYGYGSTSVQNRGGYDASNTQINYGKGFEQAAVGEGFKTHGVDLGPLGNVDDSMSQEARSNFDRQNNHNLGRVHTTSNDDRSRTYSSTQNKGYGGHLGSTYESHDEYESSNYGSPSPRDNVYTDRPDYNNRFVGRRKRQIYDRSDLDIADVQECQTTRCLTVRCTVGSLAKDQEALIALRSRINIRTIRNISSMQPVTFSTMLLARISKLPYIGQPLDRQIYSHEIFTTVNPPEPEIRPDVVPLWVVVLSAVAGTIILLLLIYLLYKCGFFKRHRPSDAPERQPLNRNGHYQNGDEAL